MSSGSGGHPFTPAGSASSVEVYGFGAWIASAVGFVLYLVWAYVPDRFLHAVGVTYFPDKEWALLFPTWLIFSIFFAAWSYESLNQSSVKPFVSTETIKDPKCKSCRDLGLPSVENLSSDNRTASVLPLMHISASVVSRVLYGDKSVAEALTEDESWQKAK